LPQLARFLLNFTHRCHTWRVLPRPQATGSQLINRCNKSLTPVELDLRWVVRERQQHTGTGGQLAFKLSRLISMLKAGNVRITNDPAEIGIAADKVTLTRNVTRPNQDDQTAFGVRPRAVVPIRNETVIDRTERDTSPGLAQIGFDGDDRGGVFF